MIVLFVRFVVLIALAAVAGAPLVAGSATEVDQAVSATSSMADAGECEGEDAPADGCFAPCVVGCATLAAATAIPGERLHASWTIDQRRAFGIATLPLPTPPRL